MTIFFGDAIMKNVDDLSIYAHEYRGYHAVINSVASYYKNSMELLATENYFSLFMQDDLIYTKVKDEVPTKYYQGSQVSNSLVANGCIIKGKVKNSILFRKVEIREGANVQNAIIMQRGKVKRNAILNM